MTVGELKKSLEGVSDDNEVRICVNEPAGYMCPDGAVMDVRAVVEGIDWHMGNTLLVPEYSLDVHDVTAWASRKKQ